MKIEVYFVVMTNIFGQDMVFPAMPDKYESEQEAEFAISDLYANYPPSGGLAPDEDPEESFPKLWIRKILKPVRT